jgi:hypothetical protein
MKTVCEAAVKNLREGIAALLLKARCASLNRTAYNVCLSLLCCCNAHLALALTVAYCHSKAQGISHQLELRYALVCAHALSLSVILMCV